MTIENAAPTTGSAPATDEFDHHNGPGVTVDPFAAFERARGRPIFWTPAWGGFWVLTRYEDMRSVLEDSDAFSSREASIPAAGWPRRLIPSELDPPEHGRYRAVIARCLAGTVTRSVAAAIRRECARLAEAIAPQGECDLVADYSRPIQNVLFASLFDVPESDVATCARWIADVLQHGDSARRARAVAQMTGYVSGRVVELRAGRAGPDTGSGLLPQLARAGLDGAPLSDRDIGDIGFVLAMASLDTLANSISFGFRYLADHPGHQHRLATGLVAPTTAVDELLRLRSVVSTARTARHDTTLAGVAVRAGDRVLLCLSLADRDPDVYPDPLAADFDRTNSSGHLAFGAGSHRCLGSGIATQAFAAALREWHRRIPAYTRSDPDREPAASGGAVSSLSSLPLIWPNSD